MILRFLFISLLISCTSKEIYIDEDYYIRNLNPNVYVFLKNINIDTNSKYFSPDTMPNGVIQIQENIPGTSNYIAINSYKNSILSLYIFNDTIINNKEISSEKLVYYNKLGWEKFNLSRSKLLKEPDKYLVPKLYLGDYYNLIGLTGSKSYGFVCWVEDDIGCGIVISQDQRSSIMRLIENKQVSIIRKILRGPSLSGQLYAAEALFFLNKINTHDQKLIDELKKTDYLIKVCIEGKKTARYTKATFKEIFSNFERNRLKELYKKFEIYSLGHTSYWK